MKMKMHTKPTYELPPGFRFHPTDEELIMCYLRNQATSRPCPVSIIPEVDIYKFDPWQLPEKAEFGEKEWYFFSPRDRKYPNGVRPNRATVSGYWKATGTDKAISSGSKYVGVKKALVFYKGRPPKGIKTDWIMHEYRLNDSKKQVQKHNGSMRLDDWVLCRIYKKKQATRESGDEKTENTGNIQLDITAANDATNEQQTLKLPKTFSLSHLLDFGYMGPIPQLFGVDTFNQNYLDPQNITDLVGKFEPGTMPPHQYTDSGKLHLSQSSNLNQQPLLLDPTVYEFQ